MPVPAARVRAGGSLENELTGTHACYNVFRCRDGKHVAVGALEPKFWEALCRAVGQEARIPRQWERDPGRTETKDAFARLFASRDRADWLRDLEPADCCVEPVLAIDEVLDGGPIPAPIRLSASASATPRRPPRLGEHTEEVLVGAGYATQDIERLREAGVIA